MITRLTLKQSFNTYKPFSQRKILKPKSKIVKKYLSQKDMFN